ncbi:MAG TPA: class I SAM-dependent methyltransferase [Terriglobia bacterium]|nr:class I SAM-dependent methyltransferase [Terriglobia bacterium]
MASLGLVALLGGNLYTLGSLSLANLISGGYVIVQPTPARFFQTVNAYQQSAAIKASIELGVFTAVGEGHETAEALAARCSASVKGMRVLCDFLVIHQFLTKEGDRYGLAPDAAMFLDKNSRMYVGGIVGFLLLPEIRQAFDDFTAVVRRGGTVLSEGGTMSYEHPVWKDFARSMMPMMIPPAEAIASIVKANEKAPMKVLDLAAGHGIFGITIARHNPNARIHAVDWAPVLVIAREHATAAGVADRWHAIEGSAFEVEFGGNYDVALITNFHHHFAPSTIETLMRKVHGALKPDGLVVTLEFVPNDDRVSPPDAASFSLVMLGTTEKGDAYTFAEYQKMYQNSGFAHNEMHRLEGSPQSVIVSRR